MAHIFITGSTDGLGRAAARVLIDEGHYVVLHARSRERASALDDLASFAEVARRAGPSDTRFSSFDDPLNKAARDVARRLSAGV